MAIVARAAGEPASSPRASDPGGSTSDDLRAELLEACKRKELALHRSLHEKWRR